MNIDVVIQIGNSDDKLSQKSWAFFVSEVKFIVECHSSNIYFFGGSENYAQWQNLCIAFSIPKEELDLLKNKLTEKRKTFNQDSIAYLEGVTKFI